MMRDPVERSDAYANARDLALEAYARGQTTVPLLDLARAIGLLSVREGLERRALQGARGP